DISFESGFKGPRVLNSSLKRAFSGISGHLTLAIWTIMNSAILSSIHRFALDDGPGIRTTVFFKGCPLSCIWCHNPESISAKVQKGFKRERCIGCKMCVQSCEKGRSAPYPIQSSPPVNCTGCNFCVDNCPTSAVYSIGRKYSVDQLVEILLRDRCLYTTSSGGVTFSGGEPGLQIPFIRKVCEELKKHKIDVAVQTSGHFNADHFLQNLGGLVDRIYFDLKLFDDEAHKIYTGVSNTRIFSNFEYFARSSCFELIASIPLIPEITATENNLYSLSSLLRVCRCTRFKLRGYVPGGTEKLPRPGLSLAAELPQLAMSKTELNHYNAMMHEFLETTVPSTAQPG
ncbi:MAG: glycyl-radical enzyme activating protein, partial [Nitrospinota bacterium]